MGYAPTASAIAILAALALPAAAQTTQTLPGDEQNLPSGTDSLMTSAGPVKVEEVVGGLEKPWAIAFLPDGRALVTEKPGRLRILNTDGSLSEPLDGTPEVFAKDQGGLMDIGIDPEFASNRTIYLSFAEQDESGKAGTALGRGTLTDGGIENFEVIFRQEPKIDGSKHFGNRIAFTPDGHIFLALAERFQFDPAQDPSNTLGTIVRLNKDGSIPQDNPFVGEDGKDDAIWSYGHRNIEAAAIHPDTGALWVAEMGPLGGDELNRPEAGKNYGWPDVSWGSHYDGKDIPDPTGRPEFADAVMHWTPVISPSGMIFYGGDLFPEWQGTALIGGLSATALVRVSIDGQNSAQEVERLPLAARIRDVTEGPDGAIYVVTDQQDGGVWRISPMDGGQTASGD